MSNARGGTILVVEDEQPLLAILTSKLTKAGFDVLQAHNGEEGLAQALASHPQLVLLDIIMPRMDGLTVFRKLRGDDWGSGVPVIFLTNLTDPDRIHSPLAVGDDEPTHRGPAARDARDSMQIRKFLERQLGTDKCSYIIKSNWKLEDVVEMIRAKLAE